MSHLRSPVLLTLILTVLATSLAWTLLCAQDTAQPSDVSVLYVRLEGTINPAKKDLLAQALQTCRQQGHDMLLLGLDTPGGLGQSMRNMVKLILNAQVPVGVWVGPKGARAASAGVFLVAASSVAGMSPQTNIGSASPVAMGGKEIPETVAKKITNDFVSLIRGVAKAKDRNVQWYERSVTQSLNITAEEAVMQRVVEFVALSPRDMLEQIGARGLRIDGHKRTFQAQQVQLVTFEPSFRTRVLSWLLHPQIAYFLLLGGIAGLFFELSNPGAIFPGVFGGICLLLGLYALAILPTNIAGLLLILLSVILFILEIAVTSYGLLSVGGVVCLFIGSLILFRFEYGFSGLPVRVILPTVIAVSAFIGLGIYLVTRAQVKPQQTGGRAMLGLTGTVTSWEQDKGLARIRGEIWKVASATGQPLAPGTNVEVTDRQGLLLFVQPTTKHKPETPK